MAINYINEDITTVTEGVIIHGVNCQGVMGAGAALAIRNKWPIVYDIYRRGPKGKDMLGVTHFIGITEKLYVGNCYTQFSFGRHNKPAADIAAVKKCVAESYSFAHSMNMPLNTVKLASDLGGLSWSDDVEPIFQELIEEYPDTEVNVYYI